LAESIQIAMPIVIVEEVKLLQFRVRERRFLAESEYLLQILLESGDQGEDAVTLQGCLEIPYFFYENFVEIGLVIFEFIDEIVAKEET
jgi:hypothetical protein